MAGGVVIVSVVSVVLSVITAPLPLVLPRLTDWGESAETDAA